MKRTCLQKLILVLPSLSLLYGTPETKTYELLLENKLAHTTTKVDEHIDMDTHDLEQFHLGNRTFLDTHMNKLLANRPKSIPPFTHFLDEARIDEDRLIVPVVMKKAALCLKMTKEDMLIVAHDPRFTEGNELSFRWSTKTPEHIKRKYTTDMDDPCFEYYDSVDALNESAPFEVYCYNFFDMYLDDKYIANRFPNNDDSFRELCDEVCFAQSIISERHTSLADAYLFLQIAFDKSEPKSLGFTITKSDNLFSLNDFADGILMHELKFSTSTDSWYRLDYAELKELKERPQGEPDRMLYGLFPSLPEEMNICSIHFGNKEYIFSNRIPWSMQRYLTIMQILQDQIHEQKWTTYPNGHKISVTLFGGIDLSGAFHEFDHNHGAL